MRQKFELLCDWERDLLDGEFVAVLEEGSAEGGAHGPGALQTSRKEKAMLDHYGDIIDVETACIAKLQSRSCVQLRYGQKLEVGLTTIAILCAIESDPRF